MSVETGTGSIRVGLKDLMDAQEKTTEKLGAKIDGLSDRVGTVEQTVRDLTVVNQRLARHSERLESTEDAISKAEVTHERLDGRLNALQSALADAERLVWWILGGIASIAVGAVSWLLTH